MLPGWMLLLVSVGYAALLFAVAWWGDRNPTHVQRPALRPVVYSLALAVYCSSWTFYGAVGSAARHGLGYLPIYLGPLLLLVFGWRILERMALVAQSQSTVSIADFIAPQGKFGLIDDPAEFNVAAFKGKAVSVHWESMFTRSSFQTPDMIAQHHLLNDVADLIDKGVLRIALPKPQQQQGGGRIQIRAGAGGGGQPFVAGVGHPAEHVRGDDAAAAHVSSGPPITDSRAFSASRPGPASAWACRIDSSAVCWPLAMRSIALLSLSATWGKTGT